MTGSKDHAASPGVRAKVTAIDVTSAAATPMPYARPKSMSATKLHSCRPKVGSPRLTLAISA